MVNVGKYIITIHYMDAMGFLVFLDGIGTLILGMSLDS